jgi:basic membrane protein A and related proteins
VVRAVLRALPLLVLGVLLAGCGGSGSSASTSASTAATTTGAAAASGPRVGLVTDIGGLNDRSFNHLAYVGLQRAQTQLGARGRVLTSTANSQYVPNLSSLARQHYDLVVAVGFLMADAVDTVAKRYPDVTFAIIDYPWEGLKSKPKNVVGLVFKQEQGGYLAGYLAGLIQKQQGMPRTKPADVVASVGGQKIPPVVSYIAGFQAGAKAADPGVKTLNQYSNDFVDQAKCKEIALQQIAQGADAIIQLAGGCGLGALDAAREQGVWGIGADADQGYLGSYILTSALKKVDVSVYDTVKAVEDGSFAGGKSVVFDVKNGGVGIGKISPKVPKALVAKVMKVKAGIADGTIEVPAG